MPSLSKQFAADIARVKKYRARNPKDQNWRQSVEAQFDTRSAASKRGWERRRAEPTRESADDQLEAIFG